ESPDDGRRVRVTLRSGNAFVGREICDYRTTSGGRYSLEDDLGEIHIFEGANILTVASEPPLDADALREKVKTALAEEFGDGFKFQSSGRHLLVHNVSEGYAEWCARLFEALEIGFEKFAAKYKLPLNSRSQPLVAVIFSTRAEFNRYALKDFSHDAAPGESVLNPETVAAYYNMRTNRIVLYDLSEREPGREDRARRRSYQEVKEILSRPNAAFNVATIAHEATHQIAFNQGVFLRTGPSAMWAIEGLSLIFETPNGKTSQGGWKYTGVFPTNPRQLAAFQEYAARATGNPLRDLVGQERFMVDVQGSYATSWALFYYLQKKKPKELAQYLNKLAAMEPYVAYSAEDRIADFEACFGDDWEELTKNLLKFIRSLRN
ncbi:MAG: DUF1570 domain-containing protein, partial [Thermoguttaceae bacterium]|nr:DUF1570 domain-containing protein [Thermoguttaceae bacterium]